MKQLLFLLTCFSAISAYTYANPSMSEVVSSIQKDAEISSITINKDGSVSFKNISVKRGDLTYPISIESEIMDFHATCKLLGFDSSLSGIGLNTYTYYSKATAMVFLTTNGTFEKIQNHHFKVDKVTCFKQGQLKTIVLFDKIDNDDKSTRIANISYLRGDLSYPVSIEGEDTGFLATCKLLGFDNSLSGIGLNTYLYSPSPAAMVFIKVDGTFEKIQNHHYKVDKLTCYSGQEPSLVVLVSGTQYMRVIP